MVQYFMEEELLVKIMARLFSCNNTHYDCPCEVIMTKNILYIQEDNFDGTFNYHFKIPLSKVKSIKKYISENISDTKGKNTYTPGILTSAVLALVGIILIPSGKQQKENNMFLKIDYQNEDNEICSIFLQNCNSKSIKKISTAFNKYKSFYDY